MTIHPIDHLVRSLDSPERLEAAGAWLVWGLVAVITILIVELALGLQTKLGKSILHNVYLVLRAIGRYIQAEVSGKEESK